MARKKLELRAEGTINERKARALDVYEGAYEIGGLRIQKVPVDLLDTKKYQRTIKETHANRIAREYDPLEAGTIRVTLNKDTYTFDVIDGQHRGWAAKSIGEKYIPAVILDPMSVSKAAKALRDKERNSSKVTNYDIYKANLMIKGKEEDELSKVDKEIYRICKKMDLKVCPYAGRNSMRAITEARRITKNNPEKLELILSIIKNSGWNQKMGGYAQWVIRGIYYALSQFDYDVSEKILEFMLMTTPQNYSDIAHEMFPGFITGEVYYETRLTMCLVEYIKKNVNVSNLKLVK